MRDEVQQDNKNKPPEQQGSASGCIPVKFREVKDVSSSDFKGAMRIYTASFPKNERHPINTIKARLSSGRSRLITGSHGSEVIFMALLHPLKGTSFLIGDYIATAKEYRGKGIGETFLRGLFDKMKERRFDYFLVEVENFRLDGDERKLRRIKFYRKLGMKELKGIRYILPPLQGTEPTELLLMVLPAKGDRQLDGEVMKRIIIQMYRELYDRHKGDGFLAYTLDSVPSFIPLD